MEARYLTWQVPALKLELSRRGARTSGRKKELIERLIAYDKNQDFRPAPVILPDPLHVGWPTSGFQQLQLEHQLLLPKVTTEQIDTYFLYRLAGDRQCTGDIKAVEKGKEMFKGERVLACSVQVKDDIYFTGIVGASMKNQVTYNYKVKIEKTTGDPINSHCECPAGKGPHGTCKHVAAVLFLLVDFISSGCISVGKSCTENLQTFHQPKSSYKGEPVEAEKLPTKRKFSEEFLDDPRPMKYRNNLGYNDYVLNCVTNYCAKSSADISFRYLYPKADIQTASKEHDYCTLKFTEHWVDTALQVTERQALQIEAETRQQSNSKEWFYQRSWRLTASKFGEICKITSRCNKSKLCQNLFEPKCLNHVKSIIHGKKYEGKAIRAFEQKMNLKTRKSGFFVSYKTPYLGASPDAVIDDDHILEIKCPYNGRNEKISPDKNFSFLTFNTKKEMVLKHSSKYYDQVQGQMYLSERKYCYFVVYTFCDIFVQKIPIDVDYCNNSLILKLECFYTSCYRPYLASRL